MIKRIILITNSFPYGKGETFLEPELECFPDNIELIMIPIHNPDSNCRDVEKADKVISLGNIPKQNKLSGYLKSVCSYAFLSGIKELRKKQKMSFSRLIALIQFIYSGRVLSAKMKRALKSNSVPINGETLIYSYWMDSSALGAYFLANRKAYVICRAHGADLYDERTKYNHQFLREFLCKKLNGVFPISEQGKKYLAKRVGIQHSKIKAFHLGVIDHGYHKYTANDAITIVSCSNVIRLKRLDLIIEALSQLKGIIDYKWIHFGDGDQLEEIKSLALKSLDKGAYHFAGRIPNEEIHKYYQNNNVSIFINASDTEGIPVSIMEAMSYGIPVIATDVGGVSEIVHDRQNGFLIPANSSTDLVKAILQYNHYYSECLTLRDNARSSFMHNWEAQRNYHSFYKHIISGMS